MIVNSSIRKFAEMIIGISGKELKIKHIPGPEGVRGRNSDNELMRKEIGWEPTMPLIKGIEKTFTWIETQVEI